MLILAHFTWKQTDMRSDCFPRSQSGPWYSQSSHTGGTLSGKLQSTSVSNNAVASAYLNLIHWTFKSCNQLTPFAPNLCSLSNLLIIIWLLRKTTTTTTKHWPAITHVCSAWKVKFILLNQSIGILIFPHFCPQTLISVFPAHFIVCPLMASSIWDCKV